jgi:hypothetical protein
VLWPCFRLVANGWAKLEDLQTRWNVEDMQLANEALDAWLAAQSEANKPPPK